jgi:hypothetical protein
MAEGNFVLTRIDQTLVVTLKGTSEVGALSAAADTIGDRRPRDVATQIAAGVQGALLVGRLSSDPRVLGVVTQGIRRYLGYVPKETHRAAKTTTGALV